MGWCHSRQTSLIPACGSRPAGTTGDFCSAITPTSTRAAGRIGVWSAEHQSTTRISKGDITAASDSARVWLAGFFAGSEPDPHDMFGPAIHDAPSDDPRWQRYWNATRRFRETGQWPAEQWAELTPLAADAVLPPNVHTVRGDEMWVWDGDSWVLADPQPDDPLGFLNGTVCAERRHHAMTLADPGHIVCDDCGRTDEVQPANITPGR